MRLEIGRIVAAQGLRGEVRVLMEDPGLELVGRRFEVDGEAQALRVTGQRPWKAGAIVGFAGVEDRAGAERLVGRTLFGEEEDRPRLAEGRFYVHELVGCEVFDEAGRLLGRLAGVDPRPAQDIWRAEGPDGVYLIPAVRATVLAVDLPARRITVRGGGVLGPDAAG